MNTKILKNPSDNRNARKHFSREIKALKKRYEGSVTKGNKYTDFIPSLLRLIYEYVQQLDREGSTKKLVKNANLKERNCDSKVDENNAFAVIIEAYVRPHFEEKKLNSAQRSKYSRALAYAHDHKIFTNWLGAFLKESGGYEESAKKHSEGQKEEWVTPQATFE